MTLREFLRVMRRRWRVVALSTLLVVAVAVVVTMQQPRSYTARSSVYLQTTAQGSSANNGIAVITAQDLNTYVAVLGSPPVLEPLRRRLGLPAGYPINVSATVNPTASILNVTAVDPDPRRAAAIANATGPQLAEAAATFSPLLKSSGQAVAATTISPAGVPSSPTSPNLTRNIELALLAGLLLGVAFALMRNVFDTKVRGESDLQTISDSPLLAALPADDMQKVILSWDSRVSKHHGYLEAVRRLRTSLMFVDVTTTGNAFLVTSAMPGEGKTSTAINLARAVAETGSRTLLVDADLRRPTVASTLGLEGAAGLTTVLLGRADLYDVIQPYGDSNLHILAAGQVPPNPSELLGSQRMAEIFEKLGADFDYVLVDSPPVLPVVDAVLLDKLTAGLVMVVAADRTRKRDLEQAVKMLQTSGVDIDGFALNKVGSKSDSYYGEYTYESDASKMIGAKRGASSVESRAGRRASLRR
ncbi:polysaccharide biosynthesis tyrosine autokinase [Yimella sp. cx-51]|uniref:polysaccharide biosynthesis tyrosine autokinase n=1 Tax=Yimella sp. cx-51 TaxID=2770551 RepID=UPI00165E6C4A|nr:polysaccharide biosynthesis tyrosine autokinase [Yimella sp. cx-51]MBC9958205.1 polysaccharide biosynthesis tyrosine autokinase [Yimella sp. cx-51]QTH38761.1 polysaccharide biosynthesis tyrosine autokinase [Yimella sp. cx-51]